MEYKVKYEKGDGLAWFTWNTQGDEALLLQYRNSPDSETPAEQK